MPWEAYMVSPAFLLTSLIVVLIPGTGAVYTISTGLFRGWRASIAAALGCTAGILPHMAASIFGLSVVLHMSAVVFHGLKVAGTIYLLYLAWVMWHDQGSLSFDGASTNKNAWQIILKAIFLNILNPKLTVFFLAFLPLFLTPNTASPILELLVLSAVFMGITFIVFVVYGVLASGVRTHIVNSSRLLTGLRRSFAAVFAVLALQLAMTDR
jgi:threonine/homoserine/homoserine lactone efflux protein